MKKRKIPKLYAGVAAGMMIGAAALLQGCNEKVYGPPPELEIDDTSSSGLAEEQTTMEDEESLRFTL